MDKKQQEHAFYGLVWFARVTVCLLTISLALALDATATKQHQANIQSHWQERVDDLSLKLQATILQNTQTVWGLAANVAVQPDIDDTQFQQLASVIFKLAPELLNIGLAPDFVIRHIYPLAGNARALGFDLKTQSLSSKQLSLLREAKGAVFTGPINLVQGGQGLAARIPIRENETGQLWGVVSAILNLDRLYESVGLNDLPPEVSLVLSTTGPDDINTGRFYGSPDISWQSPVSATMTMTGFTWNLYAQPADGWPDHPESPWVLRSLLLLITLVIIAGTLWITALILRDRRMQRRFWGLFELAPFGIALYDAITGELIRANPRFTRTLGSVGGSIDYFNTVYDQSGVRKSMTQGVSTLLEKRFRFSGLEGFFPVDDQTLRPFMLHGLRLDIRGNESVVWIITEDISERKEAERLKNEFISTVSHELRTPLTSISGSLSLLTTGAVGALPDKAVQLVEIARRNSDQLGFLINDLLDIEKLVAGKMTFHITEFPIGDAVQECLENIQNYAAEKGIQLHAEALLDTTVQADRQRLAQALGNLLSNAIKFSASKTHIDISTDLVGHHVRVRVRDYGPGIEPEFRERIFQKFSQADSSDRRTKGGTGLGLAITRELMTRMDGHVDFSSEVGHGSTFWLDVPRA